MKFFHELENGMLRLIDAFYAIWPQPFPGIDRLKSCKIISHRGEHDNHTVFENTLAAFDRATAAGVWGIECDLRWTKDLQPVILHDSDLRRVFGLTATICQITLAELIAACPLVPTLGNVIQRYGRKLHLMLEIKEEIYPDPVHQNRVLAELFAPLNARDDYHLLALNPQLFGIVTFTPRSTCIPVAELNYLKLSQLTCQHSYDGFAGHYLLLTNAILKKHFDLNQKVGTGYVRSRNCLFRELNRGVEWIFSNNAAQLQEIVQHLTSS